MSEQLNEFSATAITENQLVPWPRVAAVAAMVSFSLPTFITGLEVSQGLSAIDAVWALVWGSVIILIIGAVMGAIGANSRMSSYLLVRVAFGDLGASLVNIAFAISLLGWFGININLFAGAVSRLALEVWGQNLPTIGLAIFASICMTITTIVGFKAINLLATLLVPVLAFVTFLLARSAFETHTLDEIMAVEKTATLTIGDGISAIVGAIIIGAIILPDITRFVRHWSGAVYAAIIAYMIVQLVVMAAASLAGSVSGKTDILDIMLDLNLGLGAFAIVIAGSWVLNSLNLYSTVLSIKATFPGLSSRWLAIGLGAVGVIAALLNILDSFVTFLFYLSVIFIPVAGVIIIDWALIRPAAYTIDTLENNRPINVPGFIAWAIGAMFAVLASEMLLPTLTGIAAMDAVILAGIVYTILAWRNRIEVSS
ncbi:cytosine permease [Parasphingorhabdus sp.]|uniref:purine-cytosine permease family protein n=1 Tax=Parasphingorhabdus sp. TaxID=2709688 RepID=UPI00326648AC